MFKYLMMATCLLIGNIGYCDIPVHAGGPYPGSNHKAGYTREAWGGFLYSSGIYGYTAPYPNIIDDVSRNNPDVNSLYIATPYSNASNFGGVWFTRKDWGGWYFNAATLWNLPFNGSPVPVLIPDPNAGLMSNNGYDFIATTTLYDSNNNPQYYVLAYTRPNWGGIRYVWISADLQHSGTGLLNFIGGSPIVWDFANNLAIAWQDPKGVNADNSPRIVVAFWRNGWTGSINLSN